MARKINIEQGIAALKFLKETVFTKENIEKAVEHGQRLGDILSEAYAFILEMKALAAADTRSLEIERRIHEEGLEDILRQIGQ